MAEPYYCTADQLRTELGVSSTVLPDAAATVLIQSAEDLIDRLLGAGMYWPDETTGRKIRQADVEAWQWAKLTRATVLLAARLYTQPDLLADTGADRVKGPDFEISGQRGGATGRLFGTTVLAVLDDSGLRQLAARAAPGRRRIRPGFARFLAATRHDGT